MNSEIPKIFYQLPCLIELYGHNRIAGRVSEISIGGSALLKVDVPGIDDLKGFTKFFGMGAIYAITSTDEATMLTAVKGMRQAPVLRYEFSLPANVSESAEDFYKEVDREYALHKDDFDDEYDERP